jgi:His-Xaa-Ser repeat protein HxsA
MRRTHFLIPSLLAAGFGVHDEARAFTVQLTSGGTGDPDGATLFDIFKQGHMVSLAQHRSHSSHSSHRSGGGGHYSHTSHRSSSGGYGSYSSPLYSAPESTPTPEIPTRYAPVRAAQPGEATPPAPETAPSLSGRSNRFKSIVKRVQIGLLAQGFYDGAIDGIVGPHVRSAIRKFQSARELPLTGTITSEVLDALRVSSE